MQLNIFSRSFFRKPWVIDVYKRQMLVRLAIRCPLMLVFAFAMAFIMGGKMAAIFLLVIPVLGICLLYTSRCV